MNYSNMLWFLATMICGNMEFVSFLFDCKYPLYELFQYVMVSGYNDLWQYVYLSPSFLIANILYMNYSNMFCSLATMICGNIEFVSFLFDFKYSLYELFQYVMVSDYNDLWPHVHLSPSIFISPM